MSAPRAAMSGSWVGFRLCGASPTGRRLPGYHDPGADEIGKLDAAVGAHLDDVGGTAQARFGPQFGTTLRSLFVDSLELRTELYWTDDFPAEFAARRGYRLEPFLPVRSTGDSDRDSNFGPLVAACAATTT